VLRFVLWKLEQKFRNPQVGTITLLLDVKDASRHNLEAKLLKTLLPILAKFYPGRLGTGIVYPMSTFNWLSWKVFSQLMDDTTVKKFAFVNENGTMSSSLFSFISGRKNVDKVVHSNEYDPEDPWPENAVIQDYISNDNLECRFGGQLTEKFIKSQQSIASEEITIKSVQPAEIPSSKLLFGTRTRECGASEGMVDPELKNCWSSIDASHFQVRSGPDYKKNKNKAPSGAALYELLDMDMYSVDSKEFHIAERFQLPKAQDNGSTLPEILVVSFQVPLYEPRSPVFGSKSDGAGISVNAIFRLTDWARNNPEDPAVKLFDRFVNCFENDPFRDRLKCITSVANTPMMSLTRFEKGLFSRYNATPWLVRPQHRFFKGHGYFEIDVDIHDFSYFARKAGWSVMKRLNDGILDTCLLLQAETNEEMPEAVLCCFRSTRFQLNDLPSIPN